MVLRVAVDLGHDRAGAEAGAESCRRRQRRHGGRRLIRHTVRGAPGPGAEDLGQTGFQVPQPGGVEHLGGDADASLPLRQHLELSAVRLAQQQVPTALVADVSVQAFGHESPQLVSAPERGGSSRGSRPLARTPRLSGSPGCPPGGLAGLEDENVRTPFTKLKGSQGPNNASAHDHNLCHVPILTRSYHPQRGNSPQSAPVTIGMTTNVVATAFGGPEVLSVIDESVAALPGPGHVLMDVRAAGTNPVDYKLYAGAYGKDPSQLPLRLGMEAAGVVGAVGGEAEGPGGLIHPGDAVIAYPIQGAYASQVVVQASSVVPKPTTLSFKEAGGLLLTGCTAVHALEVTGVGAGDTVVLHGASGGVGVMAIQLAVNAGARSSARRVRTIFRTSGISAPSR